MPGKCWLSQVWIFFRWSHVLKHLKTGWRSPWKSRMIREETGNAREGLGDFEKGFSASLLVLSTDSSFPKWWPNTSMSLKSWLHNGSSPFRNPLSVEFLKCFLFVNILARKLLKIERNWAKPNLPLSFCFAAWVTQRKTELLPWNGQSQFQVYWTFQLPVYWRSQSGSLLIKTDIKGDSDQTIHL